jgi:hypothetical protein
MGVQYVPSTYLAKTFRIYFKGQFKLVIKWIDDLERHDDGK